MSSDKTKKIIFGAVFVLIICLIQVYFGYRISIFGVGPNLGLAGLVCLLAGSSLITISVFSVLAALVYSLSSLHLISLIFAFLITIIAVYFLSKKFFDNQKYLSIFILAVLATIFFNLFYLGSFWLFKQENYFQYFLEIQRAAEVIFNAVLAIIFKILFFRKKS